MSEKEEQIFQSVLEFERGIFPRASAKIENANNVDPRTLGASLARDSVERIKSLFEITS